MKQASYRHRSKRHKRPKTPSSTQKPGIGGWIWGTHAVTAALSNPHRKVRRIVGTGDALEAISVHLNERHPSLEAMEPREIDRIIGPGTVHQGLAIEAADLPSVTLADIARRDGPVVVLDQVTDPHNVGAILRSAVAFGAAGIVMQDRHSPPILGALTKAASGAAERVPIARETNLARSLAGLAHLGYWRIGLTGAAGERLDRLDLSMPVAIVAGAEGVGLRRLTAEHCDFLARIPMTGEMESLNVSNAVAVSLYEVFRRQP